MLCDWQTCCCDPVACAVVWRRSRTLYLCCGVELQSTMIALSGGRTLAMFEVEILSWLIYNTPTRMDGPIDTCTHSHKTHTHTRSLGKMTSLTTHCGIRIAFTCQLCKTSWAIADKNDDGFIHATFTLWWSHSRHVTEKEEWPPICAERPLPTTSQHSLTFTWASVGQVSWHIKRGGSANLFDTGLPLPPPPELLSLLLKKSGKLHISQQKNDHCTYMV